MRRDRVERRKPGFNGDLSGHARRRSAERDGHRLGPRPGSRKADQIVTDRNGRYVLVVRAEHRESIPGIVHGSSASGASIYVEPMATVEINNDIVTLEEQEAEEVRRILLELTDLFRARPDDIARTVDADDAGAKRTIAELEALGIALTAVTDQLLVEGLQAFQKSFDSLLAGIESKMGVLGR